MNPHNILVVDDETISLNALQRTFRRDYNVFSATNAKDALSIMDKNDIALVITDHRMPDMSGVEFLEKTLRSHPNTVRIILTGYRDDKPVVEAVNTGYVYDCIGKPWEPERVKAIVRKGIAAYEAIRLDRQT